MRDVVALTDRSKEAIKTKALRKLQDLPPFSPILNQLLATLTGENVSFTKIGDLIEKDTVVAGNLLHLVNSALYGRRGTVSSVRHAVTLLGIDKLRNAVLGMSLSRMWTRVTVPPSWSMPRFNMHSAAVGILSDLLAQRVPVEYPEGGFIAGLLHDLGQLLMASSVPGEFEKITGPDRTASELEIFDFTHAELSADALSIWNLPEPIQRAVAGHHDAIVAGKSATLPLSAVVAAANNFVNSIGVSIGDGHATDSRTIRKLGLSEENLESLVDEFQLEFEAMRHYFRPL